MNILGYTFLFTSAVVAVATRKHPLSSSKHRLNQNCAPPVRNNEDELSGPSFPKQFIRRESEIDTDIPWCFSKDFSKSGKKIIGVWIDRNDNVKESSHDHIYDHDKWTIDHNDLWSSSMDRERQKRRAMKEEMENDMEWFRDLIGSETCRQHIMTARDITRYCDGKSNMTYSKEWIATNCYLYPVKKLLTATNTIADSGSNILNKANNNLFNNRKLLLIGDSILGQLSHSLECVFVSHNSRKKDDDDDDDNNEIINFEINTKGGSDYLQGGKIPTNEKEQQVLLAAIAMSDITMINVGMHYNLAEWCFRNPSLAISSEEVPECLLINSDSKAYGRNSTYVTPFGNSEQRNFIEVAKFLQRMQYTSAICPKRVIWRETTPSHWSTAGGVFLSPNSTFQHHHSSSSDKKGHSDEVYLGEQCSNVKPEYAIAADWRNRITLPIVEESNYHVLPVFDMLLERADSHPFIVSHTSITSPSGVVNSGDVGGSKSGTSSPRREAIKSSGKRGSARHTSKTGDKSMTSDCVHFCYQSSANYINTLLALNSIAHALASMPPPPSHTDKK